MSISVNSLAQTKPAPDCSTVIKACDKALEEKNKVIKLSDLAIQQAKGDNVRLAKQVEDKDAQLNAWYRNPIFLISIGVIGGLFIQSRIR